MNRFRYEAVDSSGTPVFGILHCDSADHLAQILGSRGQTVRDYTELSLEEFNRGQAKLIPRLFQVRVGERIRDALLTGIPAHDAVRAIASEPMNAPAAMAMPWILVTLLIAMLCSLGAVSLGYISLFTAIASCSMALAFAAVLYFAFREFAIVRPRRILIDIASRLEKGVAFDQAAATLIPSELQAVLTTDLSDEAKARSAAELMPSIRNRSLHLQRLALSLMAPLAVLMILNIAVIAATILVIPVFEELYTGWGVDLPSGTQMVLGVGAFIALIGWNGLAITGGVCLFILGLIYCVVCFGWGHSLLARIPFLGNSFRWTMQARVCRMVSTLCRSGSDNSDIIQTATAISGFPSVRRQGEQIVAAIQQGDSDWPRGDQLKGVPLSMLKTVAGSSSEGSQTPADGPSVDEHRMGLATTFQNMGEMLEQAAVTQVAMLTAIIRIAVFCYSTILVVFTEVALILPLFRLLNGLS